VGALAGQGQRDHDVVIFLGAGSRKKGVAPLQRDGLGENACEHGREVSVVQGGKIDFGWVRMDLNAAALDLKRVVVDDKN